MGSYFQSQRGKPAAEPLSPLWWLEKLNAQLVNRQPAMQLMDDYYYGRHPLPFLTKAHQDKLYDEFRRMLEESKANFTRLVVDVVEERLKVDGFRLSAAEDEAADRESWDIWQANDLDANSQTAFVEALVKGVSYLSVWAGVDYPMVCVEDPLQTIVGYVPGSNYRQRAAALKVWRDDWTGLDRANVYLPDGIYKFAAVDTGNDTTQAPNPWNSVPKGRDWVELEDQFVPNPLGIVPIVPLRNRPRLLDEGQSEIADVVPVQNQINSFLFLLALAGFQGAHRQKWVAGIKPETDPKTNKPKVPYDIAVDKLLISSDPNTKFGEFGESDLAGYRAAIDQKIRLIAVTTRTPRHYLEAEGQAPSGDAIKSAESGLVKKVERKQRELADGLEEALRVARLFAGATDAPVDSEIVWADANVRTEAEITDATIKKFQADLITREQALEDMGYSQVEIARMVAALGDGPAAPPADPAVVTV